MTRIKIQRSRRTLASVSRQPKADGTHKSREADDGKAPMGEGTVESGCKTLPCMPVIRPGRRVKPVKDQPASPDW